MPLKNSNDIIRNRTRDLPACSLGGATLNPSLNYTYVLTANFNRSLSIVPVQNAEKRNNLDYVLQNWVNVPFILIITNVTAVTNGPNVLHFFICLYWLQPGVSPTRYITEYLQKL
jgi:hypothetical protein